MTSPDGINWTLRISAADNEWRSVAYGNGLWVAVSIIYYDRIFRFSKKIFDNTKLADGLK